MKLYISNSSASRIFLFFILITQNFLYSQDSKQNNAIAAPTANNFTYPQSIFIDSNSGNIWIADFDNHRVLRFDVSTLTASSESINLSAPHEFTLGQNYPNPFNAETQILFTVGLTGNAELSIYNLLGQKIRTLFDGIAEANTQYSVIFDAKKLTSGVYLYTLKTIYRVETKSMCLLK
ncbi:MAG: T9SS type A sorting domain-containing protein [Ignavibacteriaceae bacterium]|nr:T9SS type A sorting domain-containing protein [Ignavibacteriaceae bacterium]